MLHDFAATLIALIVSATGALASFGNSINVALDNFGAATGFQQATRPSAQVTQPASAATGIDSFHSGFSQDQNPPPAPQQLKQHSVGAPLALTTNSPQYSGHVLGASTEAQTTPLPVSTSGVSPIDLLNLKSALEAELDAKLAALTTPAPFPQQVAGGGVRAPWGASPPALQRIDTLTNTTITTPTVNNPSISGGTISGATVSGYLPLSGGTLTGDLTGTDLSLSGTLTAGTLTIASVTSGGAVSAPYFSATDTAATSTFSGGISGAFVHFTSGLIDTLTSTIANFGTITATNETITNSTTTNATTTNLFATNFAASTANVGSINATSTNATSTFAGGLTVGSNALTILQNGKIGIGTAAPTVALDLSSTRPYVQATGDNSSNAFASFNGRRSGGTLASPTATIGNRNITVLSAEGYDGTNWQYGAEIDMNSSASNWSSTNTGSYMNFWTTPNGTTAETERMRIADTGNIGIGITAPTALLHISTTTPGMDVLKVTAGAQTLVYNSSGNLGIASTTPGSLLSVGNTNGINFSTATSSFSSTGGINLAAGCFSIGGTCLSLGSLGLTGTQGQVPYFSGTNTAVGTSSLFISTSGNVGIGTTTPGANLVVNGTTGQDIFQIATSTNQHIFSINSNGQAAIGGTPGGVTASDALEIFSSAASSTATFRSTLTLTDLTSCTSSIAGCGSGIRLRGQTGFGNSTLAGIWAETEGSNTNGSLFFMTRGPAGSTAPDMVLTSGGNLGVGLTSPTYKLDVTGLGHFTGLVDAANFVATSSSATTTLAGGLTVQTSKLVVDSTTGYVGIGTAAPRVKLHIAGTGAYASPTLGSATEGGFYFTRSDDLNYGLLGGISGNGPVWLQVQRTDGSATAYSLLLNPVGGNIGIATTSPWKTLSVVGTMAINGLTNDTADAKTLCLTASNEVVSNSGSTCITSSQRFKNTIAPLDDASGLAEILKLNPVSFRYNDNVGIPGEQVGFIAEEVQQVDPRLDVLDASGTPFTVRYEQLTSLLAKAIQQIASITGTFKADLIAWLGSAENGITDLFAGRVHTKEICDGSTCVTVQQLAAIAAAGAPSLGATGAPAAMPAANSMNADTAMSSTTSANEPPVITINGENPAIIHIGDMYADLGATITAPQADLNLGIHLYVDGAPTDAVQLDTTKAGTHSIDYVATDTAGLTATSTRTVIVSAPANDNEATTTRTAATSTPVVTAANDNPPPQTTDLPATGLDATSSVR